MDSLPDAIHFLKSLAPFSGLPGAAVTAIASRCRRKSRQRGEALFLEGDPCHDLYILAVGRVKCFRASPEGREQILKLLETIIQEHGIGPLSVNYLKTEHEGRPR